MATVDRVRALALLTTELPRAGLDLAGLAAAWPVLAAARRGDGHPVVVLPGWLTGDPATVPIRAFLRTMGHDVSGWSLGRNRGPTGRVVRELRARLDRLHRSSGRKVSLVGWSLGGVYAQELARAAPGSVRAIVTLGSPVARRPSWVRSMSRLADRHSRESLGGDLLPRPWSEGGSLRVPATSVYTRADGIVPWRACRYRRLPRRENIEVRGSHLGLGHNPAVLWLLADRLGTDERGWTPVVPPAALRPFFPDRR